MAAPLVMLAINAGTKVVLPFLKKHPWVIPVSMGLSFVGIFTVVALVAGLVMGLSLVKIPVGQQCPDGTELSSAEGLPPTLAEITDISKLVSQCKSSAGAGFGNFIFPTEGLIYEFFGWRFVNYYRMHWAMDISAGAGQPILAASDGTVVSAGPNGSYGNFVLIDHGGGIQTGYAHMESDGYYVSVGQAVKKGEVIGVTGNAGESYGAHLHFEVRVNGEKVDPMIFYLYAGINVTTTHKVATGSVYMPTMQAYCGTPEGIYFYWCPGFDPNNTVPVQATGDSSTAQGYAQNKVTERGWSAEDYNCLVLLWNRESGWNPSATNPSSGAYGIPQALPGTKMATAGADWQTNPQTQINWGLGYIADRYGTPCGAWAHSESVGWY